jgi:hypothetical protein
MSTGAVRRRHIKPPASTSGPANYRLGVCSWRDCCPAPDCSPGERCRASGEWARHIACRPPWREAARTRPLDAAPWSLSHTTRRLRLPFPSGSVATARRNGTGRRPAALPRRQSCAGGPRHPRLPHAQSSTAAPAPPADPGHSGPPTAWRRRAWRWRCGSLVEAERHSRAARPRRTLFATRLAGTIRTRRATGQTQAARRWTTRPRSVPRPIWRRLPKPWRRDRVGDRRDYTRARASTTSPCGSPARLQRNLALFGADHLRNHLVSARAYGRTRVGMPGD